MNDFEIIATNFIEQIASSIEEQDKNYAFDLEYSNEVLSIAVDNKIFIINKQRPLEEIWLASPLSGPHHFKFIGTSWLNKKGQKITDIISEELTKLQTQKIKISE